MEDCQSLVQRTRALLSHGATKLLLRDTRHNDVLSASLLHAMRPHAAESPALESILADLAAERPGDTSAQALRRAGPEFLAPALWTETRLREFVVELLHDLAERAQWPNAATHDSVPRAIDELSTMNAELGGAAMQVHRLDREVLVHAVRALAGDPESPTKRGEAVHRVWFQLGLAQETGNGAYQAADDFVQRVQRDIESLFEASRAVAQEIATAPFSETSARVDS